MKITYFELLEKVIMSNPPKKIKVGTATYTWNGCDYILNTDSRKSLSDTLTSWTTKAQTTADFIEVVEEFLTDEEKDFLRAVIKPIRGRIITVEKVLCDQIISVHIRYKFDDFVHIASVPVAKYLDDAYEGMDVGVRYTLEELDL